MRIALSCLSFLLALVLGLLAFVVYFGSVLPWISAPDRTHITMFVFGVEFTSWKILIPVLGQLVLGTVGFRILKMGRRSA